MGKGLCGWATADVAAGLGWAQASCLCRSAGHVAGAARRPSRRCHPRVLPGRVPLGPGPSAGAPPPYASREETGCSHECCVLDFSNVLAWKGAKSISVVLGSSEPHGHTPGVRGCRGWASVPPGLPPLLPHNPPGGSNKQERGQASGPWWPPWQPHAHAGPGLTGEWECLGPLRPRLACRLLREPPRLPGLWAPDALALGDAGWLWSACLHPVLRQAGDKDPEAGHGPCTLCMGREAKPGP